MTRTGMCVAAAVLLLACAAHVWADGGFFGELAESATSVDQRAVVVFDGDRETLIIQTAYDGDATDFAWVIPVPALVGADDIGTVEPAIFEDLYYLTEPSAYVYTGRAITGCGGGNQQGQDERTVRVWTQLQVDGYDLAVLSATESADLQKWLNDNGYAFPAGHEDELAHYVNKAWFFVAAKINPNADQDDGREDPQPPGGGLGGDDGNGQAKDQMRPLRISFPTTELVYPMRISKVSTKSEAEILLYVIARHRVVSTNYNTDQVNLTSDFRAGNFPQYYEQQFRGNLARAGAGSLMVEYAGPLSKYWLDRYQEDLGVGGDGFFVTRLRTYLQPGQMEQDVVMAQAATDDRFVIQVDMMADRGNLRIARGAVLLLLALAIGITSGRRRRFLGGVLLIAIIVLLII